MNNIYDQLIDVYCKKKNIDKTKLLLNETFKEFGPELILVILQCIESNDYIISRIDGHLIRKDNMTQEEWAKENGLRIVYE